MSTKLIQQLFSSVGSPALVNQVETIIFNFMSCVVIKLNFFNISIKRITILGKPSVKNRFFPSSIPLLDCNNKVTT